MIAEKVVGIVTVKKTAMVEAHVPESVSSSSTCFYDLCFVQIIDNVIISNHLISIDMILFQPSIHVKYMMIVR